MEVFMSQEVTKKIFILGCHRSGTTMMRLVLDSHPLIWCFDEHESYKRLIFKKYDNPKNAKICGFKLPNWTDLFVDSLDFKELYNNEPILFMLRDVRAVVASMASLPTGTNNKTWIDGLNLSGPGWLESPHRRIKVQWAEEVERIDLSPHARYLRGAFFWKYKTSKYIEMIKCGWPVFPVHYDRFCTAPCSYLKLICKFLDVPWSDDLLRHHEINHSEVSENGQTVGGTIATNPINEESISKWEKFFTPEEEAAILGVAGEYHEFVRSTAPALKVA